MKKLNTLTILVILTFAIATLLQSPVFTTQQSSQPQDFLVNNIVNRTVQISEYGLITVNDTFVVNNTGITSTDFVIVTVRSNLTDYLYNIFAYDENGSSLAISTSYSLDENNTGWTITLADLLDPGENCTYSVILVFGDMVFPVWEGRYYANLYAYPTTPYNTTFCNVTITPPVNGSMVEPTPREFNGTDILPLNFTDLYMEWTYTENPLLKYTFVQREVNVGSWGTVEIKETYEILVVSIRMAGVAVDMREVSVPQDANAIRAFDDLSSLSTNVTDLNESKTVQVTFRYILWTNSTYKFYVSYKLPIGAVQSVDSGTPTLSIVPNTINMIIQHHEIIVILPPGGSSTSINPPANVSTAGQERISYESYNVTSFHQISLQISYSSSLLGTLTRPLLFTLIAGIIAAAYVTVRKLRPEVKPLVVTERPVTLPVLRQFCGLYEEKIALILEMERLDERFQRRKMKKREYQKQTVSYKKNIAGIEKDIAELRPKLTKAGGRYAQTVKKLEIREAERESAKTSLVHLESRYRKRRISVAAYQKLRRDLENKLKKTMSRMDRLLIRLKEETL
ncbi:MAG: hypothetical protein ACFFA1_05830 [Promethearchaeota archaeon]